MVRSAFLATLVVGAVSAAPVLAQAPPTPPDHYALTNARIITAPGRVIERGTVVVRNGRITAVGPQVTVPAGAIRLDLDGMTVYPGLIDAASSVGLPTVAPPQQGRGGPGGGGGGGGSAEPPQEVMPARLAADAFDASAADVAVARNAGFTTLGLAFDGGIFPGRTAAVNTGGSGSAVLRTPIAQQVLLGRRRGAYPGTLMASQAFIRQSFYNAQYDMRARQAWERQPSGPRPDYEPEARALEPAVSGSLPVWFHASAERDLDRIIEIAADIGVRNYVIVGAQEGFRATGLLRRTNMPVVVSLDWPRVDQVSGRAFELNVEPVSGRNEAAERADSAVARELRGNAAALARAGVPIALSSYGMSSPAQLRDRLRATVDAGLSPDDALRALTVTPARLLGIDAIAGTIETGKLANLVVTQGDMFAAGSSVKHVFVEGVRYDVPEPARRGQQGDTADRAASAVAGEFVGEIDGPAGLMQFSLTIAGEDSSLTGNITSEMGSTDLTGEQNGNEFTLRGTAAPPGMTAMALTITGRVTGDDLRGTIEVQGMSPFTFTARRRTGGAASMEARR